MEAITSFKMDAKLISSRLGISGLSDLYRITVGLHDDLKALLTDKNASGDTLRKDFSTFYHCFMGTKDCSPETAAAATMLHASHTSQGAKLRISQALQAGIGLTAIEMEEQTTIAAKTGKLTDRKASHCDMHNLENGDWVGLLGLAVEFMCFDDNKPRSFEEKRMDLFKADLSGFSRCSEAMAHINQLHQAASTAYGKDFITMYDLLELIKNKLRPEVRYEINDSIATDKTINIMDLTWRRIEDLVSDAWGLVSRRPGDYYAHLNLTVNHPDPNLTKHAAIQFTSHASITRATAATEDKILKCQRHNDDGTMCNADFVWTIKEQLLHQRLGYTYIPKSCPKHKPPRSYAGPKCNNSMNGTPEDCGFAELEKCRLFQIGKCTFGDQCKYAHVEANNQLAIAHPSVVEEEGDLIVWQINIPSIEEALDYEKATIESDEEFGEIISW